MLIAISKNIMVNPESVDAIEQVEDNVWVHLKGRVLKAEGFPQELVDFLKIAQRKPDFWAGK